MFCSKCGSEIKNDVNFCPSCGSKISRTDKIIVRGDFILTADGKEILYYNGTDKSVTIPASVKKIGEYAFSGNKNLQEVIFSKKEPFISIGEGSFFDCQNIQSIELPENIVKIERYAFLNCVELSHLETKSQPTEIGANVFDGTTLLYNQVWKAFESGSDLVTIDRFDHWLVGYMQQYPRIVDVDELGTVNTIATGAFSYCRNISKIVFNGQSVPVKKYKDVSVPYLGNR